MVGLAKAVEAAHRLRRSARERDIVGQSKARDLLQPGEIRTGLKMLAVGAQHQHPDQRVRRKSLKHRNQAIDQRTIVGIVHLRPVERDGRNASLINPAKNDVGQYTPPSFRSAIAAWW